MMTILSSAECKNLAKQHSWVKDEWVTTPYEYAKLFHFETIDVASIDDVANVVAGIEGSASAAIVRGEALRPSAVKGSRRLLYDDGEPATFRAPIDGLQWLMIDMDKREAPHDLHPDDRLDFLLSQLPACFHDASVYYQWSASAGLHGWDLLSAHFWFWLDEPWFCKDLRDRFEVGDWQDSGVDLRLFSPVQLHYSAAPIFEGRADPLGSERSGLIRRARNDVAVPAWQVPPVVKRKPMVDYTGPENFKRFDELLSAIGTTGSYHEPIMRVAAHYFATKRDPDPVFLREALREACSGAPRKYLQGRALEKYLTSIIQTADRKFRGKAVN